MRPKNKRRLFGCMLLLAIVGSVKFLGSSVAAQLAPGGPPSAARAAGGPTVGETFKKNVRVLTDHKDAPIAELYAAMQFMSGSLSVSCNYCHVSEQGPFDSDANKTKLKAREMIKMTRAINESNFGGRQIVTCNTCHQGSPRPNGTPSPWYKTSEQVDAYSALIRSKSTNDTNAGAPAGPAGSAKVLPDAGQIMTAYRKAVGITIVKSMHISGTNLVAAGGAAAFDATAVFPDKFVLITTRGKTKITDILNGNRGWRLTPQARTEFAANDFRAVKTRLESIFLPVKFQKEAESQKVVGIETIGDRSFYVVELHTAAQTERLYFDVRIGLLYKERFEIGTWLGTRVEEKTFEDYRDVGGVKLAFLVTNHYMEDESVFSLSKVEVNLPVDTRKFELPVAK